MPTLPAPRRPLSGLPLERMRADKRITWLTIVGILLVPLMIGGLLVWALWNPANRLNHVTAAVVNLDQPVKVNGKTVPLGRQLAAGLLAGTSSNYTWLLTDQKNAARGLADGSYVTVVTIPQGFSKAATSSSGMPADASQATIGVRTSPASKLIDPAISQALTDTAISVLNNQLTTTYLKNVYLGFNTVHDQIATASAGASRLSAGIGRLAAGAHQLGASAGQLAGGASSLSAGVAQLSNGSASLAGGLSRLHQQTADPATGLTPATRLLAAGSQGLDAGVSALAASLQRIETLCAATHGAADPVCTQIAGAYAAMTTAQGANPSLLALAGSVAEGSAALASGMPALTSGIAQSATGAQQLAGGISGTTGAAAQLASGSAQLRDGVNALAAGADETRSGSASLTTGLTQATAQLPNYSSTDRAKLAAVVSRPVTQKPEATSEFGQSSIPLFASIALWLGALTTFLVLQAVPKRAMLTTRTSWRIALDGFLPASVIGALQGVLLAGTMQFALSLDAYRWFGFAGIAAATGIAFAAVNQGLVALFGGSGRFVSMLVVVITLTSGIVSTVPGFFATAMSWLPTSAAISALRGAVEATGDVWRGLVGLLLWAAFGLAMALAGAAQRRVLRLTQLLPVG